MEKIKISVIVPTCNRLKLLRNQIAALLTQDLDKEVYEVLIVNDGSSDGTKEYLEEIQAMHTNLYAIHTQNGGPARARNTALGQAKGKIIAFTDDDCEVAPNWLSAIQKNLTKGVVGLQGLTYTDKADVTPLTHQIDNETGHNSIPTCNAAYYLDNLYKIGGFGESFPYPHNEDADIGWQMQEMGEVKFCPDMKVYHPPRKDTFKKVAKRMNILESEFTLYQKNPTLYKKYRDDNPMKHIYIQVFIKTMWYNFYSKLKYWDRPQLMFTGLALTFVWCIDLIRKFPRFCRMYRSIKSERQTLQSEMAWATH